MEFSLLNAFKVKPIAFEADEDVFPIIYFILPRVILLTIIILATMHV